MTDITNTSAQDPITHLVGLMGGSDAYIYGQEARGAEQMRTSTLLPTQGPWEAGEKLGIVRGDVVDSDPLFTNATLPEGWRRAGTGHDMHTAVLDERGIQRIGIFYKAAFYDRRADWNITNVGYAFARDVIYGDDPVTLPEKWDVLTDAEKLDFKVSLTDTLKRDQEFVERFGDDDGRYTAYIERTQTGIRLANEAS